MNRPQKIWWQGQPLIVGSIRWRVIENDLLNNMAACTAAWRRMKWQIRNRKFS